MAGTVKIKNSSIKIVCEDTYGQRAIYCNQEGVGMSVHRLFGVCTGRFIECFSGVKDADIKSLYSWIEFLQRDYDVVSNTGDGWNGYHWCSICYKPQLLIAVTNLQQTAANGALKEVGFIPSEPVYNGKYGEGSNLITWIYALSTPPKKESEICVD